MARVKAAFSNLVQYTVYGVKEDVQLVTWRREGGERVRERGDGVAGLVRGGGVQRGGVVVPREQRGLVHRGAAAAQRQVLGTGTLRLPESVAGSGIRKHTIKMIILIETNHALDNHG